MTLRAMTTSGQVEGRDRGGVALFASIPYAAPPVGARRWARPVPATPWTGVREVARFGPAAPQLPTGSLTSALPVRWSEDCLTLNVSTPAVDDGRRPVLVWIHGGAYLTGQSAIPWYSGEQFAKQGDIVTVSVNYRLGALGFSDLSRFGDEYADSGTLGLQDLVLALEWVRDNIGAFGGDPDRVTIAGESAGAFAVSTLTTMPSAAGLFRRAIAQSGAGHHTTTPEQSDAVTDLLLTELGISTIDALLAAPPEQILDAQMTVIAKLDADTETRRRLGFTTGPFYPGHGRAVVPERPIDAAARGAGADVALLTGTNLHETTLFMQGRQDAARLGALLENYTDDPQRLLAAYAAEGLTDPHDLAVAASTDWTFRIPALRMAEAREEHDGDTWVYLFTWESRHRSLRSTHALEIPFAFDTLLAPGVDVFLGPGDLPQHVADDVHGRWISFIRDGDPGWPRHRTADRQVMELTDEPTVRTDPHGGSRAAWHGLR